MLAGFLFFSRYCPRFLHHKGFEYAPFDQYEGITASQRAIMRPADNALPYHARGTDPNLAMRDLPGLMPEREDTRIGPRL